MAPTAFVPLLGCEFDAFLFAPIGVEKSEMTLTVASALARMDVDPWRESAALRDLPIELATRRLAALIEKLPAGISGKFDGWTVARRLVALLPPAGGAATVRNLQSLGFGSICDPRLTMFIFVVVSMLIALSVSGYHQTQPLTDNRAARASNLASSKASLAGFPVAISSAERTTQAITAPPRDLTPDALTGGSSTLAIAPVAGQPVIFQSNRR